MTDAELKELLAAVRTLMQPHLERSEPLRRVTELVGQFLIDEAHRAAGEGGSDSRSADQTSAEPTAEDATRTVGEAANISVTGDTRPQSTVPLRLGDKTVHLPVSGTSDEIAQARHAGQPDGQGEVDPGFSTSSASGDSTREIDLELIEQRCRLKAASCHNYLARLPVEGDPERETPLVDAMHELLAQAREKPSCFLWVFWRERTQPPEEVVERIARCYDALAAATSLVRRVVELGDRVKDSDTADAMQYMAEADSALRIAMEPTWLTAPDTDQEEAHLWLRQASTEWRIYLPRYMRLDDPATPERAGQLLEEIEAMRQRVETRANRVKQIDERFKKIRYHVGQIDRSHGDPQSDSMVAHHYRRIADAVRELDQMEVPPSDRRYRDVLDASMAESFPAEIVESPSLTAVFERLAEYEAALQADDEPPPVETGDGEGWSGQVREVRSLLAGRNIVIIGGAQRNESMARIREAFDLDDVVWVRLSEHGSSEPMRAPIARPETALVLVLIRFTGHQHAEEASSSAREFGKPCVFLKAGYNPEQIADAVLQQVSEQMRAASTTT